MFYKQKEDEYILTTKGKKRFYGHALIGMTRRFDSDRMNKGTIFTYYSEDYIFSFKSGKMFNSILFSLQILIDTLNNEVSQGSRIGYSLKTHNDDLIPRFTAAYYFLLNLQKSIILIIELFNTYQIPNELSLFISNMIVTNKF